MNTRGTSASGMLEHIKCQPAVRHRDTAGEGVLLKVMGPGGESWGATGGIWVSLGVLLEVYGSWRR